MILSRVLSVQGLSESETERRIMDRMQKQSNPTLALYARPGFIALRITARAESEDKAEELIEKEEALIKDRLPLGDYHMEAGIRDALTKILIGRSLSVSAAESCTGGLIGKLMTDLPGSSSYLWQCGDLSEFRQGEYSWSFSGDHPSFYSRKQRNRCPDGRGQPPYLRK